MTHHARPLLVILSEAKDLKMRGMGRGAEHSPSPAFLAIRDDLPHDQPQVNSRTAHTIPPVQRLTRRDWLFLLVCAAVFAVSLFIALHWFTRVFPEASIDFRYDRASSRGLAEAMLAKEGIPIQGMKQTAVFDADENGKIFLERSLGLEKANAVMRRDVRLWFWHHRWFKPQQEEELSVDVAPTGEIVAFHHKIPEELPSRGVPAASPQLQAEAFLARVGVRMDSLQLVSRSERKLPKRVQQILTWESKSVRPAGAPYRYVVTVDGNTIGSYSQSLRVPDGWQREYQALRSKNLLAGNVDTVFFFITIVAALVVFIVRLRRGDLKLRFLLAIGAVAIVLTIGVAFNSFPSALAGYETTDSFGAFLGRFAIFGCILPAFGTAIFLIVLVGCGEVLYRERLPQHLAIPRLWTPRALRSKRVFLSFVLGYALVAFFLGYQVVFYLVAGHFGAWAPAELPYDEMLNSALPWVAVLFAGFFPALSEEFMSRAFSIPFFERVLRSRVAAVIVAGFIWGFGHATYPNQPFFIRGLEVGLAGVLIGFLFNAYGLLPLLIWHYTVDALYTALLLFRSGNPYYVFSAGMASLVFAIPMLVSIVLYLKHGGFLPDDDLSNATLPLSAPPEAPAVRAHVPLPPPLRLTRPRIVACVAVVLAATLLIALRPPSPQNAVDYATAKGQAKAIAAAHTRQVAPPAPKVGYEHVVAIPLEGFRNWDAGSSREDGGGAGGFDEVAAEYLVRQGMRIEDLTTLFRNRIEAATWMVRFFTPLQKEELFVEVDPRRARVIGYHKYQNEKNPGARLEQPAALGIATAAFARYAIDPALFDLQEALAFQQANRRDWLFHFQEKKALAGEGYRWITVRVAGAEVTQFTTTVHVPEAVYREAAGRTILNVILVIFNFAGAIILLGLVIAGFVLAAMRRRPNWLRAARWMAALAIVPLLSVLTGYERSLFAYTTSISWETFTAGLAIDVIRDIGMRLGGLFLAVAAIDAALPYGLDLIRREGRIRFGRSAVLATISAIAALVSIRGVLDLLAHAFPAMASVRINVPEAVAVSFPAVIALGEAAFSAVIVSGAIAAASVALRSLSVRRHLPAILVMAAFFGISVDASSTLPHAPLMFLQAAVLAGLGWVIARHVLGTNALSWPVAIFTYGVLQSAASLLRNDRVDLQINGGAELIVLAIVLLWVAVKPASAATPDSRDPATAIA
jgi:membrane protease YdiL (CAAX protease family)